MGSQIYKIKWIMHKLLTFLSYPFFLTHWYNFYNLSSKERQYNFILYCYAVMIIELLSFPLWLGLTSLNWWCHMYSRNNWCKVLLLTLDWACIINDCNQRHPARIACSNRQTTLTQITSTLNAVGIRHISSRSVLRSLASMGYGCRKSSKVNKVLLPP